MADAYLPWHLRKEITGTSAYEETLRGQLSISPALGASETYSWWLGFKVHRFSSNTGTTKAARYDIQVDTTGVTNANRLGVYFCLGSVANAFRCQVRTCRANGLTETLSALSADLVMEEWYWLRLSYGYENAGSKAGYADLYSDANYSTNLGTVGVFLQNIAGPWHYNSKFWLDENIFNITEAIDIEFTPIWHGQYPWTGRLFPKQSLHGINRDFIRFNTDGLTNLELYSAPNISGWMTEGYLDESSDKVYELPFRFDGIDLPNIDYMDTSYSDQNDVIMHQTTGVGKALVDLAATLNHITGGTGYFGIINSNVVTAAGGKTLVDITDVTDGVDALIAQVQSDLDTKLLPLYTAFIALDKLVLGPLITACAEWIQDTFALTILSKWDVSTFANSMIDALLSNDFSITLSQSRAQFTLAGLKAAFGDNINPPKSFTIDIFGITLTWYLLPYMPWLPIPGFLKDWIVPDSDLWTYEDEGEDTRTETDMIDLLFDLATLLAIPVLLLVCIIYAPQAISTVVPILLSLFRSYSNTQKFKRTEDILQGIMTELGIDLDNIDTLADTKLDTLNTLITALGLTSTEIKDIVTSYLGKISKI